MEVMQSQSCKGSLEANRWIDGHYQQLTRLANTYFSYLSLDRREEAVAEVLAMTFYRAHQASQCGRLELLTPSTCVYYAANHVREGRQFAGAKSVCVLGEMTRVKGRTHVQSLNISVLRDTDSDDSLRLSDVLADRTAQNPYHIIRQNHDYPMIFNREHVSGNARYLFRYLARTKGEGMLIDCAEEMGLSKSRMTQLRIELSSALGKYGYRGPLGTRPGAEKLRRYAPTR